MDPIIGDFAQLGAAGLLAYVMGRFLKRDAEKEKLYFDFLSNHLSKVTQTLENLVRTTANCPGPRDEEDSE